MNTMNENITLYKQNNDCSSMSANIHLYECMSAVKTMSGNIDLNNYIEYVYYGV